MKKKPQPTPVPRMGEVIHPRQDRNDGWNNFLTMMGTSSDKRTHSHLTWDLHPPEFYEQLYSGGGIPARIVDIIPEESMREWVDWTGVSNEQKRQIEDRCDELDLRGNFLKAWKWGRAYGGGCLHIVTDTRDPSSPLQEGEKVIGLRDLSRWDLRILTTDVEYDFGSPNWGHPRIYYLNVQMGAQYKGYPIHWTRMIRFDGQLVPRRTYIRNNYWHDSVLNRIYNSIRNYETSNDAAAAALQDFNVDVYKLKNVANFIQAGKEQIIKSRIEMMQLSKSVINAMILDADQEEYENKGRSLEGVAELLVHQANRLVAETDIPHTKLLGESPDGSNATGNSTSQQWYNFLAAEQKNYAKAKLQRLIHVIFPEMKGKLGFKFRPLRVLDDMETAELRNKQADTDTKYIDSGVLDPTEVTASRFGGEEWTMDTALDVDAREAGLIGPGSNDFEEGDEGDEGEGEDEPTPPKGGKSAEKAQPKPAKEKKKDAAGESEFEPRNEEVAMKGAVAPKTISFISQTMSEPMRNPQTDPQMKGPGIPNKPRTFLPTRGNGVTAQSGFDFEKDAGSDGEAREAPAEAKKDEAPKQHRAACIIVRDGDKFLMGKRRDTGRWTLPGGMVEDGESHHQGAVRELHEETSLQADKLKFLGSRIVEPKQGRTVHVNMYEHSPGKVGGKIRVSNRKDPDNELDEFRWVDSKQPLPEEIAGNLQHPNNVALQHLGLLK